MMRFSQLERGRQAAPGGSIRPRSLAGISRVGTFTTLPIRIGRYSTQRAEHNMTQLTENKRPVHAVLDTKKAQFGRRRTPTKRRSLDWRPANFARE